MNLLELSLSKPRWQRSFRYARTKNRIVDIIGMESSYPSQQWAQVDASIADLILDMNEAGVETTYCCSGMDADHENYGFMPSGYIAFRRPLPQPLAMSLHEYMEGVGVIRIPRLNEAQIKEAWDFVRDKFNEWKLPPACAT